MKRVKFLIPVFLFSPLAVLAAAIAFGGPTPPEAMTSINEPFKSVDFSDVPDFETSDALMEAN